MSAEATTFAPRVADARQSDDAASQVAIDGTVNGRQRITLASDVDIKAARETHKRDEEREDNKLRRRITLSTYYFAMALIFAVLVLSTIGGFLSDNDQRQMWGLNTWTLVIGSFLGYLTGKVTR